MEENRELHLPGRHDQREHGNWARKYIGRGKVVEFERVRGDKFKQEDFKHFDSQYKAFIKEAGRERAEWRASHDIIKGAVGDNDYVVFFGQNKRVESVALMEYDPKANTTQVKTLALAPWNTSSGKTIWDKMKGVSGKSLPIASIILPVFVALAGDFLASHSKFFYVSKPQYIETLNEKGETVKTEFVPKKFEGLLGKMGFYKDPVRENTFTFSRSAARDFVRRGMKLSGSFR